VLGLWWTCCSTGFISLAERERGGGGLVRERKERTGALMVIAPPLTPKHEQALEYAAEFEQAVA
jgi:hypothetical protein